VSCPSKYADDTFILIRGDVASVSTLKHILDIFSAATGLHINFRKSTFIPMNLDTSDAPTMASLLQCDISFPQPYLGLPLSPHKLKEDVGLLGPHHIFRPLPSWLEIKAFELWRPDDPGKCGSR
jgi:hypothetical protein